MPDMLPAPGVATPQTASRTTRPRPPPTDEALMKRAQRGDSEAFGVLFDRHVRLALGITRRICGPDLAEDATQSAFLSAWRARESFSTSHGSFRSWLCRISHNRALDLLRSRRSINGDVSADTDLLEWHLARGSGGGEGPEEIAERTDEEAEMRTALGRLPEAQREVIVLAYFGGMTHLDIAEALDLPTGTVKGRMRLGLTRLRRDPHVRARWPDPFSDRTRIPDGHSLPET